ncbi:MAG: tRNA (N(6)-L-threonylcarbamoyladenosine(37)-C(2))-methylthiotransferase MtaB [Nitrospirae bacterium]|nr:tRNA (N(6)-L-threonylcarbamoyladenosine(37)-C(2))-methylthiotransferase MtaB [Nitrospirota bacterium]MCL5976750.1 tRNA (N(6)-L-threonylcarbamoyladenosine(37)-C(2))-methylthiotransferase MtaB [Nitrospirota bacterium]
MEHALNNSGHQIVKMPENPDLCVINTCTVTAKSDYQSRQMIRRALNSKAKVIVTGCYAQLNKDFLKNTYSDITVIENKDKSNIINRIIQNISSNTGKFINTHSIAPLSSNLSRHRPIVKVQDGCNYSCSYCAIHIARGKSKSVPVEEVINQIKRYESMGYNEVVLTGIHLGTYGLDLKLEKSLSILLKNILKNTVIPRIRLSSLEIREFDEELLEVIAEDRICNHLHIPLQSGDDSILKLMNRMYSSHDFISGIEKILKRLPDVSIGTDVIVGFPSEGKSEFKNTGQMIESIPFSYLHVFPYSKRPGTKAMELPGEVTEALKKERATMLREIGAAKKAGYIRRNIGKTLDAVIENRVKEGLLGTTRNYIKILIEGKNNLTEGMLANVHVSGLKNNFAVGVPITNTQLSDKQSLLVCPQVIQSR